MTIVNVTDPKTGQIVPINLSSPSGVISVIDQNTGNFVEIPLGSGGGGGGVTTPAIVQTKSSIGATGSVTFDSAPTVGNLLVAFATHWSNAPLTDPADGWNTLVMRNGNSVDGDFIAYKWAGDGESATQSIFGNLNSANVTMYEISGGQILTGSQLAVKEGSGSSATRKHPITMDGLLIGITATVGSDSIPTISGATAGTSATGTGSGGARAITPFHATVSAGVANNITATWSGSVTYYLSTVLIVGLPL